MLDRIHLDDRHNTVHLVPVVQDAVATDLQRQLHHHQYSKCWKDDVLSDVVQRPNDGPDRIESITTNCSSDLGDDSIPVPVLVVLLLLLFRRR